MTFKVSSTVPWHVVNSQDGGGENDDKGSGNVIEQRTNFARQRASCGRGTWTET